MTQKRTILILGGGISGLTALHVLKQKFQHRTDIDLILLERSQQPGGCLKTSRLGGGLFEHGPTGFQKNSSDHLLRLIDQLELTHRLIEAEPNAKIRFLRWRGKLNSFPQSPVDFLRFPVLTIGEKIRFLMEWFTPKPVTVHNHETVVSFGYRHFGSGFTNKVIDAIVTGIYAGDMHQLIMARAFPRMTEWEQKEGSLLKTMVKHRKQILPRLKDATLMSFDQGMGVLPQALWQRYRSHIITDQDVRTVCPAGSGGVIVATQNRNYYADALICALPLHIAAKIFEPWSMDLARLLRRIRYASVAVVGLAFDRLQVDSWMPRAFGYLIPKQERKNGVLGVLFHTRIFPSHAQTDHIVRVMMGGVLHDNVLAFSDEELIEHSLAELKCLFEKITPVRDATVVRQIKAIPQYDENQLLLQKLQALSQDKGYPIFIGSAFEGVAVGQCVTSAWNVVDKFSTW